MPGLSPQIIDRLVDQAAVSPQTILIPTLLGRRGHPVLLPWGVAHEVPQLAENEGLSALIDRQTPRMVVCDDLAQQSQQAFADIDTPADLAAFANSKPPPAN
jgi:molybdenum cofactor cytidylyltransferase